MVAWVLRVVQVESERAAKEQAGQEIGRGQRGRRMAGPCFCRHVQDVIADSCCKLCKCRCSHCCLPTSNRLPAILCELEAHATVSRGWRSPCSLRCLHDVFVQPTPALWASAL